MRLIKTIAVILALSSLAFAVGEKGKITAPVKIDAVGDALKEIGFNFEKISFPGDGGISKERLKIPVTGENGNFNVIVNVSEELEIIYLYIPNYLVLPLDEPGTMPMLAYLMNQNRQLSFGRFEWDIDSGEVRLSHSLPVDDGISTEVLKKYFTSLVYIADTEIPKFKAVMESFGSGDIEVKPSEEK